MSDTFRSHSLAALLLASGLAACGGGSGSAAPSDSGTAGAAVSQPGELAAFVQGRLRTLNAEGRLASGTTSDGLPATTAALSTVALASASPAPARSSTLVQEAGVDEADLIQSDGTHLYTLQPQALSNGNGGGNGNGNGLVMTAYSRASDGRAQKLSALTLPTDGAASSSSDGMVMSSNQRTLAVISQHWTASPQPFDCIDICAQLTIAPQWMRSSVTVQALDVSSPATASAGERINIDGFLIDVRRIGDALYVVTAHRPALAVEHLTAKATTAEREAAIAKLSAADLLPRMRRNGGAAEPLLADTDCYVQASNASTAVQFTTITVFDLRSATLARSSRCIVGGSEALYMSTSSLYLATTRWPVPINMGGQIVYPQDIQTDIHKFALTTSAVDYRGSGRVDGHLGWDRQKSSLRLSEHKGDLRVLTFTGSIGWGLVPDNSTAPSPARLSVLRERASDKTLQTMAALPNATRPAHIGKPGEQVYAVRFLGDRGYVVTFRRTDPLYVLDLSDPADPKTVGELTVAGFSEFLFPLPNNQLLGVGRDADSNGRVTGLKMALFDVSNPTAPTERASLSLGAAGSSSALDGSRHGLNMLLDNSGGARVALPVLLSTTDDTGWQRGLQKVEVDTAAGTLRLRGLAAAEGAAFSGWVGQERSLQIGDNVYYLNNGVLSTSTW